MTECWGIWRERRDRWSVRGDWLRYDGRVRTFDTRAAADRVCTALSARSLLADRHLRFYVAPLAAGVAEDRPVAEPVAPLDDDEYVEEARRDAQMAAWDDEWGRRRAAARDGV
jgi:hypothetical protein